jgi:hypothetical protein
MSGSSTALPTGAASLEEHMKLLTASMQQLSTSMASMVQDNKATKQLTEDIQQRMANMDQRLTAQEQAMVAHSYTVPTGQHPGPSQRALLPAQEHWNFQLQPQDAPLDYTTKAQVAQMISQALSSKVAPVLTAAMTAVDQRLTVVEQEVQRMKLRTA